jgi:hypothetical protein
MHGVWPDDLADLGSALDACSLTPQVFASRSSICPRVNRYIGFGVSFLFPLPRFLLIDSFPQGFGP